MTRKRKLSGATPATRDLTRSTLDPKAAEEARAFQAGLDALFDYYLEHGCPCRFPRFRATVARDTREVGAAHFTTWEQQWLVNRFDARVELSDKETRPLGHRGRCARCGAEVDRWSEEPFRSAWIDYLRITAAPGTEELGAHLHTPVPYVNPFFSAAPQDHQRDLAHVVQASYPRVSAEVWLAWMRELAGGSLRV